MDPIIIYCYDAYCGWCYGFSKVMQKFYAAWEDRFFFEVLSGGMILAEQPVHISASANYIKDSYKSVEELTGVQFGADYLWHIYHNEDSDWYPDSEKPAIALCIFKEMHPDQQVMFATELQYALHSEGRDLCDDEAYRHLLEKYGIPADVFYENLHSAAYREKARYEFSLVKQLQVTGFPTVFLQTGESKFYLLARGYTDFNTLQERMERVLEDLVPQ